MADRRSAARPAPKAEVFIRDFGPLAASIFEGAEPLPLGRFGPMTGGFPAVLGRRGFGVGRSVAPGFFRIAKSVFSKIASNFGGVKDRIWPQTTRSAQADTSETKVPIELLLYQSEGTDPP